MTTESGTGAYGFRIDGLDGAGDLLVAAPSHWPHLEFRVRAGQERLDDSVIDDDHADLRLIDGIVAHLVRSPASVELVTPEPLGVEALIHPYLSATASLHCHWLGRESLHGGAFVAAGRAWGVLADREGGKSTTLACLAEQGAPALADDLVAIDGGVALSGPRSIDLREEPRPPLGTAEPLGRVGARFRWRVAVGPVPAEVPLGGWFFLGWSDDLAIRRLSGVERLRRLGANRRLSLRPRDPMSIARLAALPGWEVLRPPGFGHLEETVARMLALVARS